MGRQITVTPERLETAAGAIITTATDYKNQYTALYSETDALASTWQGEDNAAFKNQIDGFKDDLEKMYNLMNQYAEFLKSSAKAYRTTQADVVNKAKALIN